MSPERSVSVEERAAGNPLGYQPIGRLLLNFSIPSVISMLVNSIYNIVDQIFIGQGVGELGNAATTVSFPMVTIMLAFATLIGSGGSAYAALKLGEGKNEEADRTLNNVFVMALGAGSAPAGVGAALFGADAPGVRRGRGRDALRQGLRLHPFAGSPLQYDGHRPVQHGADRR